MLLASLGRGNAQHGAQTEPVTRSEDDVLRFIAASFPSGLGAGAAASVEERAAQLNSRNLVQSLRASELVVGKTLDALVAAGLATITDEGAAYAPVNQDAEDCVELAGAALWSPAQQGLARDRLGKHEQRRGLRRSFKDPKGHG